MTCFSSQVDFTSCGGLLCIASVVLMIIGIVTAIVLSFHYIPWLHMLYAAIGAIVYTLVSLLSHEFQGEHLSLVFMTRLLSNNKRRNGPYTAKYIVVR